MDSMQHLLRSFWTNWLGHTIQCFRFSWYELLSFTEHFSNCRTVLLDQYLNCRGNAGGRVPPSKVSVPPSRFSVPPSRFRRPPIEIWAVDDETINSQPARINPTNPAECSRKLRWRLFVFGLHLISEKKHFSFWRRPFFFDLHLVSGKNTLLCYFVLYCALGIRTWVLRVLHFLLLWPRELLC